VHWENH